MAAMLLGHWYLNAPGMELAPLRRLLVAMAALRSCCKRSCAASDWRWSSQREQSLSTLVVVRRAAVVVRARRRRHLDLDGLADAQVPNTQSATGILYVAVIGVFVGETMSLLLSAESVFPL